MKRFPNRRLITCLPALLGLFLFSLPGTALSQVDNGGGSFEPLQGGGGGQDQFQDPTQQQVDDGGTANADGGGTESDGELEAVEPFRLNFQIEERRNQGFVGPTAEIIDIRGFVGPSSESSQLPLGEERSLGGGINGGRGNRQATTTSVELQENGFTVERKSIRSRLRPAFAAPSLPGFVAESRFQSRIARQPVVQRLGHGITVTVANRKAVLTGVANSEAERQIIKRQLRLEPGVYGIVDQTTLAQ